MKQNIYLRQLLNVDVDNNGYYILHAYSRSYFDYNNKYPRYFSICEKENYFLGGKM